MKKKSVFVIFLTVLSLLSSCSRKSFEEAESSLTAPIQTNNQNEDIEQLNESALVPLIENAGEQDSDWEKLYTPENPTTDVQEMVRILNVLHDRYMSQIDKAGWYRSSDAIDTDGVTYWIHLTDSNGWKIDGTMNLTQFWRYAPGFTPPNCVLCPDGNYGTTRITMEMDDYFYEDDMPFPEGFESDPIDNPHANPFMPEKTWPNLNWFFYGDYLDSFRLKKIIWEIQNPYYIYRKTSKEVEFNFEAWFDKFDNIPVFVLKTTEETHAGFSRMESGELIKTANYYAYIDLKNGVILATLTDYTFVSGNTHQETTRFNPEPLSYFETLPEKEQSIYDEACRRLVEFESQKQGSDGE